MLHVGDRVCVYLPAADLKQVQRGRGGWSMRMTEVYVKATRVLFHYCIISLFI